MVEGAHDGAAHALPRAARAARVSAVGRSRPRAARVGVETRVAGAATARVDSGAGAGLRTAGSWVDIGKSFTLSSLGTVNPIRARVIRGTTVVEGAKSQ